MGRWWPRRQLLQVHALNYVIDSMVSYNFTAKWNPKVDVTSNATQASRAQIRLEWNIHVSSSLVDVVRTDGNVNTGTCFQIRMTHFLTVPRIVSLATSLQTIVTTWVVLVVSTGKTVLSTWVASRRQAPGWKQRRLFGGISRNSVKLSAVSWLYHAFITPSLTC